MEKIIEIANFRQTDRAEVLASVLRSEGIDCYVRNEVSARTFGGLVDIGARVEVLESDVPLALEIIKTGGFSENDSEGTEGAPTPLPRGLGEDYLPPEEDAQYPPLEEAEGGQYPPSEGAGGGLFSQFSLDIKMTIFIILLAALIALIMYLGSFLSDPKY